MEDIKQAVAALPHSPGVYQFVDINQTIIYIGKAKDLKKRVASYFYSNIDNVKTRILVRKIVTIKHIVVQTESDALLLENNLIKEYQPRYNVLLKDDKSYPWIRVTAEDFPRVFFTRNAIKDGSKYYGPYTSLQMVRTLLELIKQLYPLRTCKLSLSEENITQKKYKRCLEYHIGNCKAPCVAAETKQTYNTYIENVHKILSGKISQVITLLKEQMLELAEILKFEEAHEIKLKIEHLENYRSRSTVVNMKLTNLDVYSIISDDKSAYINFLKVVDGAIIQAHTIEVVKKLDESDLDLLTTGIVELRNRFFSTAPEIIVPIELEFSFENVKYTVPKIGDKLKLLQLSERNAKYYRLEKIKRRENIDPLKHAKRILGQLQKDLALKEMPFHIECFDNSNLQGTNAVAACVVFKDAKPSKADYRHFNIKTVDGPDDFASMREIVYRRYKRLLDEKQPLPQLIVIDGGKGQLSAAYQSLTKLNLDGKIAIIGIAKKLEEIYYPADSLPLYINKNSESLKIIQHLRNEAHRFAITFHRNKRSKNFIDSELLNIEGVGEKTANELLKFFKSVTKVKEATEEEIAQVVGKTKAKLVRQFFDNVNL